MTNLRDDMQTLVDDLRASLMNRRASLEALADETRYALRGYRAEQQQKAQDLRQRAIELRTRLAAQRKEQASASRRQREDFMTDSEQRRVSVSELRSEVHSRMERHGMERREAADEQWTHLGEDVQAIKDAVQGIFASVDAPMKEMNRLRQGATKALHETLADTRTNLTESIGAFREDLKDDLQQMREGVQQMREIWRGRAEPPPRSKKTGRVAEAAEKPEHAYNELDEHDVFSVIASHPHGISLVHIGEALGVEWRSLIGLARALVDEGRVEKVENQYYPKK